jgi:phosphopantothenoylcysteine synthetase/decarboxylase
MATILLCVTGSIAAYKAADLASKLKQSGHDVTVIMSAAARELVSENTFLNLTGNRVYTDLWDAQGQTEHIALTDRADLVVVAPATANCLAKMAHGLADDIVSTTLLAVASPVLVCPAMNTRMWKHPAVRHNLELVRALGHVVVEPGAGALACGHVGPGRLPETPELLEAIERALPQDKRARRADPASARIPAPERRPTERAASGEGVFLELVTFDAPLEPAAIEEDRAYRATLLASGQLVSSGGLGGQRRAHVHRARSVDEALERARRSPIAGRGCRIEVFPWRLEDTPPP